jgi:Prokaryotic cytochrome b561
MTSGSLRLEYQARVMALRDPAGSMRRDGPTLEAIARAMHADRRRLSQAFEERTPEPLRTLIYDRSLAVYRDPLGPSAGLSRIAAALATPVRGVMSWEQKVADRSCVREGAAGVTAPCGSGGRKHYLRRSDLSLDRGCALPGSRRAGMGVHRHACGSTRPLRLYHAAQIVRSDDILSCHIPIDLAPPIHGRIARWEACIAWVNHWSLYAIMIVMPLTGYILSVAAARPSPYFWLFYWPQPTLSPAVTHAALRAHLIGQFFVYAFVGLHLSGIVWHVVIRRDGTLERMLPAQVGPRTDKVRARESTGGSARRQLSTPSHS